MKNQLVRDGRHQRPMLAVLTRYGIGTMDQYGRGRWISSRDLPAILAGMESDPGAIRGDGRVFVPGTCRHNYVAYDQFTELFRD